MSEAAKKFLEELLREREMEVAQETKQAQDEARQEWERQAEEAGK